MMKNKYLIILALFLLSIVLSASVRATIHATVNLNSSYDMNVLVLKYFPLTADGQNIDITVTGDVGEPYTQVRQRTIDVTNALKSSLENGSRYLGYKDPSAPSALRYHIIDTKEYKEAVPIKPKGERSTLPDYYGLLERNTICHYVNDLGVNEVWLWAYQGPGRPKDGQAYLGISESKMSGPHGDISNSWRENDMPLCNHTYRLYTFNFQRGTSEALESWGHQLETEIDAVDSTLYRKIFQGPPHPATTHEIGRCGSVHNPPNARSEYDRDNPATNKSDCLDWTPDSLGTLTDISCQNWGCEDKDPVNNNSSLNYQVWMMQNMPGRNNPKTYQGEKLRNWWDVHGDFDAVITQSKALAFDPSLIESHAQPSSTSYATTTPPQNSSGTSMFNTGTGSSSSSISTLCNNVIFTRRLALGSRGSDVRCLQIILNSDPETIIASSGAGSPGNESDYLGIKTRNSIIRFQEKYATQILTPIGLMRGSGVIGNLTTKKLNALLVSLKR